MDPVQRPEAIDAEPVEVMLSQQVALPNTEGSERHPERRLELLRVVLLEVRELDVALQVRQARVFRVDCEMLARVPYGFQCGMNCDRAKPRAQFTSTGVFGEKRRPPVVLEEEPLAEKALDVVGEHGRELHPGQGAIDPREEIPFEGQERSRVETQAREGEVEIRRTKHLELQRARRAGLLDEKAREVHVRRSKLGQVSLAARRAPVSH